MTTTQVRRTTAMVAVGLLVGGGPSVARALEVEVTTVRATPRGPCDPQLAALRPRLRRLVGYRAFTIVQNERRAIAWRSEQSFLLPDGRVLRLLPKGVDDDGFKMQVRLLDGRRRLVDTNVRVMNPGTVLFGVGRDARGADGAMIIMLQARE